MTVTRRYETKEDCANLMVRDNFSNFDSTLITQDFLPEHWMDHWSFYTTYDRVEDYDPDDEFYDRPGELAPTGYPMWNTWFEITGGTLFYNWCDEHQVELAEMGFILIYHDDELWGLGIDGCGYSFYDAHWIPLYDALEFKWHTEDEV